MTIFWILRRQNLIGFLDSIDSIESTDSINIIDSLLVPHKKTANIHTTHKGARSAPPHRYFCSPFVCGVNVGGLFVWHKYRIYNIYKSVDSVESIESRKMFFERADLQKMWFFSARTSNKVIFKRVDLQKHDFEKSVLSPDSNSSQKVTSNALVDS